jgi:hypothetical protein
LKNLFMTSNNPKINLKTQNWFEKKNLLS